MAVNVVNERREEDERDDVEIPYYGSSTIVECSTTAGPFAIEFHQDWSPIGYERAVELFDRGFYDESHFFRVVPGFLVQFGISYTDDKELQKLGRRTIKDDPQLNPRIPFDEGIVSFAGSGKDSRTSHLFVAYGPNSNLGTQLWETPVGVVIRGMDTLRTLNHEYGDMPPWGHGPEQHKINARGREYIESEFPHLDRFVHCHVNHGHVVDKEVNKEEVDVFGGRYDEKTVVRNKSENVVVTTEGKGLLRNAASAIQNETEAGSDASRGLEVPILLLFGFIVMIFIGVRKNKKSKVNKAQ